MRSSDTRKIEIVTRPLSLVLADIGRHTKRFLFDCWNWKAAALSVLFRAPVFFLSTQRHGFHTMATAGIVESVFRMVITGINASITQSIEWAEPQWMVAVLVLAVIPGVTMGLEAIVHSLASTPNLLAGLLASLALSVLSSGFNWFSMRKGALLVGREAASFGTDLSRMPMLIGRFVASPFLIPWRAMRLKSTRKGKPQMFGEKAPF